MTPARTRIDIRPSAWIVIMLTVVTTWLVGFLVVLVLSLITMLLVGRTVTIFDRLQVPLLIMALAAGIIAGLLCLLPQTLVIDAEGLSVRRGARTYRVAWDEVRILTVVRGQGVRWASWYLMLEPADPALGDRSRDLRWHRGGLWLSLWTGRAATLTALALQEYASHRYVGVTTTDAVPQSPWPGRG